MPSKDGIQAEYFQWLCNVVQADENDRSYLILMDLFHKRVFEWFVENDRNRAEDGLDLRKEFSDLYGCSDDFLGEKPCSFLEMLIGIAVRMEFILYDPNFRDRTGIYFWVLIENMGLEDYTDSYYSDDPFFTNDVKMTMDRIINRTYCRNGYGSLFPVKRRRGKDWRRVELWYQLNEFLVENYDIDDLAR